MGGAKENKVEKDTEGTDGRTRRKGVRVKEEVK